MFNQPNPQVWGVKGTAKAGLNDFFEQNAVKPQLFYLDPSTDTTLVSANGMRLTFAALSFADQYGQIVTDEIQIELREVRSWQEMIFSNLVTGSGDRFLESAGPFHLKATKGGRRLRLNNKFTIEFPLTNISHNQPARLFRGSTSITRTLRGRKVFDWEEVSPRALKIKKVNGEKYYHFELASFNWWNCQYYYNKKASRAMVSVRLPFNLDRVAEKQAFLVFEDLNAVLMMYAHGNTFSAFNIPTQLKAKVILLASNEGQLYFGQESIEQTENKIINAKMQLTPEREILRALFENEQSR